MPELTLDFIHKYVVTEGVADAMGGYRIPRDGLHGAMMLALGSYEIFQVTGGTGCRPGPIPKTRTAAYHAGICFKEVAKSVNEREPYFTPEAMRHLKIGAELSKPSKSRVQVGQYNITVDGSAIRIGNNYAWKAFEALWKNPNDYVPLNREHVRELREKLRKGGVSWLADAIEVTKGGKYTLKTNGLGKRARRREGFLRPKSSAIAGN